MNFQMFSYRFAQEIIEHPRNQSAWEEITRAVNRLPLFIYPKKSRSKTSLDVTQQMLNTYFDRVLSVEHNWRFHPLATDITDSGLRADFFKQTGDLAIQAEIQFGNIARWYSDVFKFQTAYSQGLINIGLSIVPKYELAVRIDQNVANYERAVRELPSAKLSITLPILLLGLFPDKDTPVVDVSKTRFKSRRDITANSNSAKSNRFRIVNAILADLPIAEVGPDSPVGPTPSQ